MDKSLPAVNANGIDPAFAKGLHFGRKSDSVMRGMMALGLTCAGDVPTVVKTRQWLAGYDSAAANSSAQDLTVTSHY